MKKLLILFGVVIALSCQGENDFGCLQSAGDLVQKEFDVDHFTKIIVWKRVKLVIGPSEGRGQKVVVETGSNLMDEIEVRVEDSILKVSDRNSCNLVRNYGTTTVFVTTPDLKEIRNSSGETVESRGIITFRELTLLSEDRDVEDEFHIDGDFNLSLDVGTLHVGANGISTFYLRGRANNANYGLYDGDARVEAGDLKANNVSILHRSTNKIICYPIRAIKGEIRSIGDVIAKNRPPVVEVDELFTGRLIFE